MTNKKPYTKAEAEIIFLELSIITENSEIRTPEEEI